MDPAELDRLERDRRDADRRYNDALTALDRKIVASLAKGTIDRDDTARFAATLLTFLQQITGFVDTKSRQQAAAAAVEFDRLAPALEAIAELRSQVGLLQRRIHARQRDFARDAEAVLPLMASDENHQTSYAPPAEAGRQTSAAGSDLRDSGYPAEADRTYVGFEDEFRGDAAAIELRLQAYVPIFAGATGVLDLGCGRGEFLAALKAAGVNGRGIDVNVEMVEIARERGLDAVHADALTYLTGQADESIGGLIATQVVEHLEPGYLMRLLDTASRKLRPGAPIVVETINAACWLAFFSSYIRDVTHVRPIHPDTLQFLLRASGFERVSIHYSAPVPEHMKMKLANLPADVLGGADPLARAAREIAHTLNANATILNNLMFTHLDFAAVGYRS